MANAEWPMPNAKSGECPSRSMPKSSTVKIRRTTDLGLYVHIPFCSAICNYCNFNRGLFDAALKERYVEALLAEIGRHAAGESAADTVFFGGGTPSLLEPEEIGRLIGACRRVFEIPANAEITLET